VLHRRTPGLGAMLLLLQTELARRAGEVPIPVRQSDVPRCRAAAPAAKEGSVMRPGIRALAFLVAVAAAVPTGAVAAEGERVEIVVYAATSLRDVLRELAPDVEAATGSRLVFNLGASNDLARQIVAANEADVFFSADEAWMDHVAEAGLLDASSRRSPLSNRLVVVVAAASGLRLLQAEDLAAPAVRRLSLAQPDAVPAGKYARAWLERRGLWASLSGRIVPALDVRAALAAVEFGGADAGIVYRTDAAISKRARVAFEVPENEGPAISYALTALRDRPRLELARAVVARLCAPEAGPVYERFGFVFRAAAR
jgi:molybdate transport system substrate-binding protein